MSQYTGPTSFAQDPFSVTNIRSGGGGTMYRQLPDGSWQKKEMVGYAQGDSDERYEEQWVPISGEPPASYTETGQGDYGPSYEQALSEGVELDYNYDALRNQSPELFSQWTNYDSGNFMRDGMGYVNAELVSYDKDSGVYTMLEKTGDKKGTLRYFKKNEAGGVDYLGDGGEQEWDTNKNVTQQTSFNVAKVAAAPLLAYGAQELMGGLQAGGFGAAEGTVAAANMTTDPLGALLAQNAPNWGLNIAPEFAAQIGGELLSNMPLTQGPPSLNGTEFGPLSEFMGPPSDLAPDFMGPPGNYAPDFSFGPPAEYAPNFSGPPSEFMWPPGTTLPPIDPTQTRVIIEAAGTGGGANSLVSSIARGIGVSEDVARLIVGLGPAVVTGIGNLLKDDKDNQVTRTGNPTIDAAREQVVTKMIGGLDERIARDRARSDKLAGWSDAAAAIPQGLPQYRGLMETDELGRVRFRRPRGLTG